MTNARNAHLADPTRIGKRLRELRSAAGMTQTSVVIVSKLSESTIWNLERGRHNPNVMTLAMYCAAVGATIADLFTGESP